MTMFLCQNQGAFAPQLFTKCFADTRRDARNCGAPGRYLLFEAMEGLGFTLTRAKGATAASSLLLGFMLLWVTLAAPAAKADESSLPLSVSGPTGTGLPTELTRNPLAPPDTSSPRATLGSFLEATGEASRILEEALRQQDDEPGLFPSPEVEAKIRQVRALLSLASQTFDFSKVPEAVLSDTELESVLLLTEILDRVPLPPLDQVPGFAAVHTPEGLSGYQLPGTEIRIALDESQPFPETYLFDSQTVEDLQQFYRKVRHLPKVDSSRTDLYEAYSISPGRLLPPKWFWLVLALPEEFRDVYHDQAVWQWIALAIVTLFSGTLSVFVIRRSRRRGNYGPRLLATRRLIGLLLLLVIGYLFGETVGGIINITGQIDRWINIVLNVLAILVLIWAVLVIANLVVELIIASPKIQRDSLDANLLRVCVNIVAALLGAVILTYGAAMIGLPLVGVIAGLGVGGLAVALAVRPTLENFIGFILLYTDRPVRIGDRCRFGDLDGYVETIGIRSTRLRAKDHSRIIIQNSDFAEVRMVNLAHRDRRFLHEVLRLSPDTTSRQLEGLLSGIRKIMDEDEQVLEGDLWVDFKGTGPYSFDIEIHAPVASRNEATFSAARGALLLKILHLVEDAGTSLAFLPPGVLPDGFQAQQQQTPDPLARSKADTRTEDEALQGQRASSGRQRS